MTVKQKKEYIKLCKTFGQKSMEEPQQHWSMILEFAEKLAELLEHSNTTN